MEVKELLFPSTNAAYKRQKKQTNQAKSWVLLFFFYKFPVNLLLFILDKLQEDCNNLEE